MAVPQGPLLFKKLEKDPAANNRGKNTGKGIQQELPHRHNLLCGKLAHTAHSTRGSY